MLWYFFMFPELPVIGTFVLINVTFPHPISFTLRCSSMLRLAPHHWWRCDVVRCRGQYDWDAKWASICDTWNGLFLKKAALQHFLHTSQTEVLFKHPPAESSGAERKSSSGRELAVQLLVCLAVLIRETCITPLWANLLYNNHNYCICRWSLLSLLNLRRQSSISCVLVCFQASPRHQPWGVWWRRPLWNHRWLWNRTQLWLRSVWEGEASKWFDFLSLCCSVEEE